MSDSTACDGLQRGTLVESDFVAASPSAVVPLLADDAIHLWRLPYCRAHGRTPLRALLATYLGVDADAVVLHEDEYGKPQLVENEGRDPDALRFNWSHSGGLALGALARGVEPGVDVERSQDQRRSLELAHRFFDPAEALALAAFPEAEREAAFLRLWCAKESVLKALGRGIAFGLERVAFAREADNWRPARFAGEAGDASAWQMRALNPASGYIGALAWYGPPRKVQAWRPLAGD